MKGFIACLVAIVSVTLAGCTTSPQKPQPTEAQKKAYLEASVILTACTASDFAQVKALVEKNPQMVNAENDVGETPLGRAVVAMRPNEEVVRYLLDHGANVHGTPKWGESPLHGAAGRSSAKIVELLLQRGAKVNALSRYGSTPMFLAAWNNRTENADVLLAHGAEMTVVEAGALGKTKKLEELLRSDPQAVNARDKSGWAPLHWAVRNGHLEAVRLLLKHGADPHDEGRYGITPCYLARERQRTEIVAVLRCP